MCGNAKGLFTRLVGGEIKEDVDPKEVEVLHPAVYSEKGNIGSDDLVRFVRCGHEQVILRRRIVDGKYKCKQCLIDKHQKEAWDVGLILLEPADKAQLATYLLPCGHLKKTMYANVRKNSFECEVCILGDGTREDRYSSECDAAGWEFLGKTKEQGKGVARGVSCGHQFEYYLSYLRSREGEVKPECPVCRSTRIRNAQLPKGVSLSRGEVINRKFRIKFDACGHEEERLSSSTSVPQCKVCKEQQYKDEASENGFELLKKESHNRSGWRFYKHKVCGTVSENMPVFVRYGVHRCYTCNPTNYNLPTEVYILQISVGYETWLKVGVSKATKSRHINYGLPDDAKVTPLLIETFADRGAALKCESSIKKSFKVYRLNSEDMRKFHSISGYTECYSTSALTLLQQHIKQAKGVK